jgi:hypothetical protein
MIKTSRCPTVPWDVFRGSNDFKDFLCHKSVTVSDSVTVCHIYFIFQLAYFLFFFVFFELFVSKCYTVTQCNTFDDFHTCGTCHKCHIYHCRVSLAIKKCCKRPFSIRFQKCPGDGISIMSGGWGWVGVVVKKCFLGFWQTALLSSKGKKRRH